MQRNKGLKSRRQCQEHEGRPENGQKELATSGLTGNMQKTATFTEERKKSDVHVIGETLDAATRSHLRQKSGRTADDSSAGTFLTRSEMSLTA